MGDPAGGALTPDQVRLVRRRLHNRESARRSRTKRQMTYEEQTLQVPSSPLSHSSTWTLTQHTLLPSRAPPLLFVSLSHQDWVMCTAALLREKR